MQTSPVELVAALREGAGAPLSRLPLDESEVGARLRALIEAGRLAHPELAVPPVALARHVGAVLPAITDGPSLCTYLARLRGDDLHLAVACCLGLPGAHRHFERHELRQLPAYLGRLRLTPPQVEEVRQALAIKLLVAAPGERPRIAEYSGRGPIGAWVRVSAVRLALDLQRGGRLTGGPPADRELRAAAAATAASHDPEMAYLKRRYGAQFRAAVSEALAALPGEQREILRLNFVDGLNIDAIAGQKGVHRSTVARWIAAARAAVFDETRRRLEARLGLRTHEFESLIGMLDSQLEMSLSGLVRPRDK